MMPILCAAMSCSSGAIRRRSAIAAWAAVWARTSSARACACRIEYPMSQAMTTIRVTTTVTTGGPADPTVPPRSEPREGTARVSRPAQNLSQVGSAGAGIPGRP
jgi:hypothetical protein